MKYQLIAPFVDHEHIHECTEANFYATLEFETRCEAYGYGFTVFYRNSRLEVTRYKDDVFVVGKDPAHPEMFDANDCAMLESTMNQMFCKKEILV